MGAARGARLSVRALASIGGVSGGASSMCSMASTPYLYFSMGTKGLCSFARVCDEEASRGA
jgi:hypothetical protein